MNVKRLGIVADHGGFALKEQLLTHLRAAGHETIDFEARSLDPDDHDPDVVVPLARAVASGKLQRNIAIGDSGVGAAGSRRRSPEPLVPWRPNRRTRRRSGPRAGLR